MDFKFLEVSIGLVFIYLLLSIFCMVLMEFISTFMRMRAEQLKSTIKDMLNSNDKAIVEQFYKLPLMQFLGDKTFSFGTSTKGQMPSSIKQEDFYYSLLNFLQTADLKNPDVNTLITSIRNSSLANETKTHLNNLLSIAGNNVDVFKVEVEKWFEGMMERANSWYKRQVQYVLFFIGLFVAIFMNADTIRIANELSTNDDLRLAMVSNAEKYIQNNPTLPNGSDSADQKEIKQKINTVYKSTIGQTNGLLGWDMYHFAKTDKACHKLATILSNVTFSQSIGILLTALALSLGANFWFDLLKKLINLRVLGKSTQNKIP